GQSTPRVIALVLAMPGVKLALGLLTFTYAYTLAALGRVSDRVPDLHVSIAVFLNLGCIVVFLLFVQRLATNLRPSSLIQLVADHARGVFEQMYPLPYDPNRTEQSAGPTSSAASTQVIELAGRSGTVVAFGTEELVRVAAEAEAVVELVPQVGAFVAIGDPLFRPVGRRRPVSPAAPRGCL